jgi:hypothetical protein
LYQGDINGTGNWTTITIGANTVCRSVSGSFIVGNYNISGNILGSAFIYNIKTQSYQPIVKPGSQSTTAYSITRNKKHSYTIAGGYSDNDQFGLNAGYVVDYDSKHQKFSNWTSYWYLNDQTSITHFEGISGCNRPIVCQKNSPMCDKYTLVADISGKDGNLAAEATIRRNKNGQFIASADWTQIMVPNQRFTTGTSITGETIIGTSSSPQSEQDKSVNGMISIVI